MSRLVKCSLWVLLSSMLILAIAAVAYRFSGSVAIESWVGSQLLDIGGSYLQPTLHFERLTYQRPRTIVLKNLMLSSPDPAHPGQSVVILAVRQAQLTLTEIPERGQPIRFSEVILESPEIRAIAVAPGAPGFVGFAHLLKESPSASAPAGGTAPPEPPMKLSDFLLIRRVKIHNGLIRYDPRIANTHPLELDGINTTLDFTPETKPGVYTIQTAIVRKPVFALELQGQVNIDTMVLQLARFSMTLELQKNTNHYLPPALQSVLAAHEVTGRLRVEATGTLPLANYRQAALHSTATLTAAQVAVGEYRLPLDSLESDLSVSDGAVNILKTDAELLGGQVHLTGTVPLYRVLPMNLAVAVRNIQIQKTLRSVDPNTPPAYAGNVNGELTFAAPLDGWNAHAGGKGKLTLRDGRIDTIPVVGGIITTLNKVVGEAIGGGSRSLTDRADVSFAFTGDRIQIDQITGSAGALALRGDGTVGFDGQMDLRLNAGPMERLQNALGDIGRLWASASDALAGYRITGFVGDPHVSVEIGNGR
jgi:hypothetical protein